MNNPYAPLKWIAIVVVAVAAFLAWNHFHEIRPQDSAGSATKPPVKVGDKLSLTFKAAGTNETVNLSNYAGKIVVIDFWATWCEPCMALAPHLVDLNARYAPQGVVLIGVSLDDDPAEMARVAAAKGFTWVQCCDGMGVNSPVAQQFGVDNMPRAFVLSTDGTVLWTGHPADGLDQVIEAALKAHPPVLKDPKSAADAHDANPGGPGLFGLAESYRSADNLAAARKKYQEVIDKYPGTTWAADARKQLGSL